MDSRKTVIDTLKRLAFALELTGGSPRSASAYAAAAQTLKRVPGDLRDLHESGRLLEVRGVGRGVARIVGEVLAGREIPELVEAEARFPPGLRDIGRIKGLGPKKVKALWEELSITTLGELEYACRENRLITLKGFGTKTQDAVLAGIALLRQYEGRYRLDRVRHVGGPLVRDLDGTLVGDARRGCEVVERVEIVTCAPFEFVAGLADDTELDGDGARFVIDGVPVVAHLASPANRGVVEVLATGSDHHVALLATRARERGLTLHRRGLVRDGQAVPCPTEADVYTALGLVPTAPERREAGVPLVEAGKAAPRLVRREDLLGALHNHTTASDGSASLEEMRAAAAARGLSWLGISDHSKSAFYARGLADDALIDQRARIAALNGDASLPALVAGVESDILRDGALDYPEEVLGALEHVIASVHSRLGQGPEEMTARMVAAAKNPWTTVIGHPTGRLLLGRPPAPVDVDALIDACAASGCAVELNASPYRLDLDAHWLARAKERGVRISLAADAHAVHELDYLDYGIAVARRAGLGPEDLVNCLEIDALRAWLGSRRAAAAGAT